MEIQVERQTSNYEWCCRNNLSEDTIGCDVASNPELCPGNGWYHYSRVNLRSEEIDNIKKYICNTCHIRTGEHTEYYHSNTLATIDTNQERQSQQIESSGASSVMEIDSDEHSNSENELPQPNDMEVERDEFVVKRIIKHGLRDGKTTFLVEWEGYPRREDCTWILETSLSNCYDMIVEYRRKNRMAKTKLTPRGGALPDESIGEHNLSNWVDINQFKDNITHFLEQERYESNLKIQIAHLSDFKKPKQDSLIAILHKNHYYSILWLDQQQTVYIADGADDCLSHETRMELEQILGTSLRPIRLNKKIKLDHCC